MSGEMNTEQTRQAAITLQTFQAVEELFDQPSASIRVTYTPEDSEGNELEPVEKEVVFKACKLKHMQPLTVLIHNFVAGLGDEEMVRLLDYVSKRQEQQMQDGQSPYLLNTEELVGELGNTGSLLTQLFAGAVMALPPYIELFTNVKKAELDDMDPLTCSILAYGVFARNFSFFIQNGSLLFHAFMASVQRRSQAIQKKAKG